MAELSVANPSFAAPKRDPRVSSASVDFTDRPSTAGLVDAEAVDAAVDIARRRGTQKVEIYADRIILLLAAVAGRAAPTAAAPTTGTFPTPSDVDVSSTNRAAQPRDYAAAAATVTKSDSDDEVLLTHIDARADRKRRSTSNRAHSDARAKARPQLPQLAAMRAATSAATHAPSASPAASAPPAPPPAPLAPPPPAPTAPVDGPGSSTGGAIDCSASSTTDAPSTAAATTDSAAASRYATPARSRSRTPHSSPKSLAEWEDALLAESPGPAADDDDGWVVARRPCARDRGALITSAAANPAVQILTTQVAAAASLATASTTTTPFSITASILSATTRVIPAIAPFLVVLAFTTAALATAAFLLSACARAARYRRPCFPSASAALLLILLALPHALAHPPHEPNSGRPRYGAPAAPTPDGQPSTSAPDAPAPIAPAPVAPAPAPAPAPVFAPVCDDSDDDDRTCRKKPWYYALVTMRPRPSPSVWFTWDDSKRAGASGTHN